MKDKAEQRPDTLSVSKSDAKIRMDDPSYVYREFSNEKPLADLNRVGRFKDKYGYEVVSKNETRTVMACKKEDHEKRQAASRAKSESFLQAPGNSMSGDGMVTHIDSFETEKGGLPDDD